MSIDAPDRRLILPFNNGSPREPSPADEFKTLLLRLGAMEKNVKRLMKQDTETSEVVVPDEKDFKARIETCERAILSLQTSIDDWVDAIDLRFTALESDGR